MVEAGASALWGEAAEQELIQPRERWFGGGSDSSQPQSAVQFLSIATEQPIKALSSGLTLL